MKNVILGIVLLLAGAQTFAQQQAATPVPSNVTLTAEQQQIIKLSKDKWRWMEEKKADTLAMLFDDKANFVHMGGTWGKAQEVNIIRGGGIWYKKAEIYSTTVNVFGNTAILMSDIDLVAALGSNEVTNAFMVTEVYIKESGKWRMAQLTFSHLSRPVRIAGK